MTTNRVQHIFKDYDPPVIHGSFNLQKTIEQPPQANLTIQYIPKHKINDYIKTYAEYGKFYTFYNSTFIVDSFRQSISSVPNPSGAVNRIETYDLQITYKAFVAARGTNYTTPLAFMPETSSQISAVPFAQIASEAGLSCEGLDFMVKRADYNEVTKLFSYPILEMALQYSKLYGHYVFLDRGNKIIFKPLNEGRKHIITNSLKYRLFYRQINTEKPVILEDCFTSPLYETYDEYFNTESANLPYYVPKPLPSVFVCTQQRTEERPAISKLVRINSSSGTSTLILNNALTNYQQTNVPYPSGSLNKKCTYMLGSNVIMELEEEYAYNYPKLAVGGASFRNSLLSAGEGEPPVIFSRPNYAAGEHPRSAVAEEVLTSRKIILYDYAPLNYFYIYSQVANLRIKVIDGTGEYFVRPTIVNRGYGNKQYLFAIKTDITVQERINKKTNSVAHDLFDLDVEIDNLKVQIEQLERSFALNEDPDIEERLEFNFSKLELEKNLAKLYYLKSITPFFSYKGIGRYYYYVSLYDVNKDELIAGQLIRSRPESFGIDPIETDRQGFAYYIVVDPNWVPPLWVFKESNQQLTEINSFMNPSNLDVYFERSYKANYLKEKLNLIINDTCNPNLSSLMPNSLGSLDPEWLPEEYRGDSEIINLAAEFYKAITTQWEPNLVRGWDTKIQILRRLATSKTKDIEVQTGNVIDVPFEAYIEEISENNQNYSSNSSISRSQSSYVVGRPPAPKMFEQPYVALDIRLQRPDRFIYKISTPNLTPYLHLGNLNYYMRRRQQLPDFPTTSFEKYKVALETTLALEEMQSYKVYSLQLFGLFDKIDTGDYIQILDVPELASINLRVNIVDFTIEFKGVDPDGELLALCQETKLIVGEFRPKQITWTKERIAKLGSVQYYVYKG
ncbi:MAG: hypothetical protein ABIK61_07915 [candidate division WOR-3 bacterium]